jgi:hypothetical protein
MAMNRTEAVRLLATNGKTAEVLDLINSVAEEANRAYENERADGTRTDEWKRWSIATYAKTYMDRMNKGLIDLASKIAKTDRDDAARVFGVVGLEGDPASLQISRRDAVRAVAEVARENPNELYDMLLDATRSGDEVLARAIAAQATDMQNVQVMQRFLDDRPALEAAGERLWNAKRGAGADTFQISAAMSAVFPAEFRTERAIEFAAMEPEPGTPAADQTRRATSPAAAVTGTRSIFDALAQDQRY